GSRPDQARDFVLFYVQGFFVNQGTSRAVYDMDRVSATISTLVPSAAHLRYPPVYGPQIAVLFSPLARLPYATAMAVWLVLTLVMYLACGLAIWKVCPRLRDRGGVVALLLLADPALRAALGFGHISAIALVCVTGAFLALRARRPFVAG